MRTLKMLLVTFFISAVSSGASAQNWVSCDWLFGGSASWPGGNMTADACITTPVGPTSEQVATREIYYQNGVRSCRLNVYAGFGYVGTCDSPMFYRL